MAPMQVIRQLRETIAAWTHTMLEVVYPRTCRVCDLPLPKARPDQPLSEWFCTPCSDSFEKLEPPHCQTCGTPFDGAAESTFECSNCAGQSFAFEFAIASFHASGHVRDLVHRFKYNSELSLRAPLADMLHRVLQDPRFAVEDLPQWTLVPVPLHHAREREREFNQSWELCRQLARQAQIPAVQALKRIRPTEKQARLTRHQRLQNLRGAFAMRRQYRRADSPLRGRSIILVDDVFTTGATTNECARILRREGGAQKVVVISVARG